MKKQFLFVLSFVLALSVAMPLFAQSLEVYQSELLAANEQEIQFTSYTGPVTVFNTMEEIRGIGRALGEVIQSGEDFAGEDARYSVLHASAQDGENALGADVLFLGSNVAVDHIRNLRAIISGFLEVAYGYSVQDADTLATFITVYNAVYRQNPSILNKYTAQVASSIDEENLGLATHYREWAGSTAIVIPLTGRGMGSLSAVDTAQIADKDVIKNLQEESNKGVDVRSDMSDLKEREALQAETVAQEAAKAAVEAQKNAKLAKEAEKQAELDAINAQNEADQAQIDAENATKIAEENPLDADARQKALEAQQNALEKQQEANDAQQKALEAQQQAILAQEEANAQSAKATNEQIFADKKRQEAQTEIKEIEKDKQNASKIDTLVHAVYGLQVIDSSKDLSTLVLIDRTSGKVLQKSSINAIRGRTLQTTVVNNKPAFVAIAGLEEGNGAVRLALIDGVSLEMIKQSTEPVYPKSALASFNDNFYVVINLNGKNVLAKYNKDLTLTSSSTVAVMQDTPIFATEGGVCVCNTNGDAVLLSIDDLSSITK